MGHGKNYIGHGKNYIRHNQNYIRPFFSVCKYLKNKSLQQAFQNRQFSETQHIKNSAALCRQKSRHSHFFRSPACGFCENAYFCSIMKYSIIIPVYNRPDEVGELLESIAVQPRPDVEVVIVEDGSQTTCEEVVARYQNRLHTTYLYKENGGPAVARNYGARQASGEWLIILDSDVVLPPGYFEAVDCGLEKLGCDAFGGPDRAADSFTPVQKAISYAMTSFFTTGGIRGGKKKMDKFYPRSYNMGIRSEVYQKLGGFSPMRFGEDIDFSYRIVENGYKACLIPQAWVWHKRRTDFRKFFRQVYNSGIARINLEKRHPGTMKPVHTLPALFTVGCFVLVVGGFACLWSILPLALYALLVFAGSLATFRSLRVALLSVPAAFIQLIGYGSGFIVASVRRNLLKENEFEAFKDNFYK